MYQPEKFNQQQFVCNMAYLYSRLLNFKTKYCHYESKSSNKNVSHELTSEYHQTFRVLRSLARNKSIIITRPDKGRGKVIMNRSDYVQKMNTILDDRSTFTQINHNPAIENETKLRNILLEFKKTTFYNLGRI